MEGINHEAIGLAGHLELGRLIVLWDDNSITIDGSTELSRNEDVVARHQAAQWHTCECDGLDADDVSRAIDEATRRSRGRASSAAGPSSASARPTSRGPPRPTVRRSARRRSRRRGPNSGCESEEFAVPDDVLTAWRSAGKRGASSMRCGPTGSRQAAARTNFSRGSNGKVSDAWLQPYLDKLLADLKPVATRKASEMALEAINAAIPATIGGSADLTGSNNTKTKNLEPLTADNYAGRYIYYGIREFGMAAAMNGMALHGGVIPYGGTFLVFTDYARPAIRLSALQKARVIYVMTHDFIGLGEDGPTHQPIEHLQSLRAIPQLEVYRPADAVETAECWALALASEGPSILALTRQNLRRCGPKRRPRTCQRTRRLPAKAAGKARKVILLATGSEVEIALDVAAQLEAQGIGADVVSMPCTERFDAQPVRISRGHPARRQQPRDPARLDRGGDHLRLGALHRASRPQDRHRPFRRLCAGAGRLRLFRPYARQGRCAHHGLHEDKRNSMTKVAINGFGRIGRLVARAILERPDCGLELVSVNDLADAKANAWLFKHDSVHGKFPGEVTTDGNDIIVDGKRIHVTAEKRPGQACRTPRTASRSRSNAPAFSPTARAARSTLRQARSGS